MITLAWAFFTMPTQEELEQQRLEQLRQDSLAAVMNGQPWDGGMNGVGGINGAEGLNGAAASGGTGGINGTGSDPSAFLPNGAQDGFRQGDSGTIRGADPSPRTFMGVFENAGIRDTVLTVIRTPRHEFLFTNLGAGPAEITLRNYDTWDDQRVQMVRDTTRSALSLGFLSEQNYNIETSRLLFEPLFSEPVLELTEEMESLEISYRLDVDASASILYTYRFYPDQYSYDFEVTVDGLEPYMADPRVDLSWNSPLRLTEKNHPKDAMASAGYVYAGGVLEKVQLTEIGRSEERITGNINWIATRTQFFGQFIKPLNNTISASMSGEANVPMETADVAPNYLVSLQSSIANEKTLQFQLYSGPLRYYDLKDFDEHAYDVIEVGYAIIRWFADPLVRFLVIPFFTLGSTFIGNFGILIILFGVIIKLALYPLTQKSFKSIAAMKELQPQMQEIKEKFKDNPQKQQKATMDLYKKAKVNPLGGCLPMLLQFPILITLFYFLQNSMLMRQESFLWASDLSAPDYIFQLPFAIPFLGDQIAGFVLLMTGAMFLQMKVSGGMSGAAPSAPGTPNMKAFQYIMPFILLFVFNNFASGLSLYYLVYNVLSAAQQFYVNKKKSPSLALDADQGSQRKNKASLGTGGAKSGGSKSGSSSKSKGGNRKGR